MRWGRVWHETCMRWREHRLNNQFYLSMRHSYSTQGDTAHTNRPRPFSLPPLACFACASQELGTRQTGKRSLSINALDPKRDQAHQGQVQTHRPGEP